MDQASREMWAKRVERWKDSGLTAAEFAAEIGIKAHSLTWWKWRLGTGAGKSGPVRRSSRGKSRVSRATSPLTFVEMSAPVQTTPLEVVLPTHIRIRVPSDFDAAALGRLLGVLDQHR